jgi:hypothetical protein
MDLGRIPSDTDSIESGGQTDLLQDEDNTDWGEVSPTLTPARFPFGGPVNADRELCLYFANPARLRLQLFA